MNPELSYRVGGVLQPRPSNAQVENLRYASGREQVAQWLRSVYKRLPVGICDGCTDCALRCAGEVPLLAAEYQAIRQYLDNQGQAVPPQPEQRRGQMMAPCRFLDKESHLCTIYPVRPLICRLFGLVEWLPCPTGKQSAEVTDALELMRQYAEVGPRPFSLWQQQQVLTPSPSPCRRGEAGGRGDDLK